LLIFSASPADSHFRHRLSAERYCRGHTLFSHFQASHWRITPPPRLAADISLSIAPLITPAISPSFQHFRHFLAFDIFAIISR
jgi:hypothetical protein